MTTLLTYIQSIDVSRLQDLEVKWKGNVYENALPKDICHDILRDIFFISFVTEFLLADRFLYVLRPEVVSTGVEEEEGECEVMDDLDATTREERNIKVMDAIPGLSEEVLGFGSPDLNLCQRTLYGFYWAMLGWTRMPGPHSSVCDAAEKLAARDVVAPDILDYAEYLLAHFYIAMFADFFKCAPVCPHLD